MVFHINALRAYLRALGLGFSCDPSPTAPRSTSFIDYEVRFKIISETQHDVTSQHDTVSDQHDTIFDIDDDDDIEYVRFWSPNVPNSLADIDKFLEPLENFDGKLKKITIDILGATNDKGEPVPFQHIKTQ
jgi:hypothetical protein